MLFTSSKLL